jgi:hypothetical protein
VCRFFATVTGLPVVASFAYLLLVYMPRNRGGSGPDLAPDFTAVLPIFTILILVPVGIALSVAAVRRRERHASLLLWFYALAAVPITITILFH